MVFSKNEFTELDFEMSFLGRSEEKKRLARFFASGRENAALVWGRWRVGKSELIKAALRECGARSIYFECQETTEALNARALGEAAGEALGLPPLPFDRLEPLLDWLFRSAEDAPLILALDEWPFLRDAVRGADSILQSLLDRHRETSRLKVVLCGSRVSAMAQTLSSKNPLYGRFGLALKLEPMDYLESSLFYPDASDEDKVRYYAVFGGIPYWNSFIEPEAGFRENLVSLAVDPRGRLENEVPALLRTGFSRLGSANAVLESLSAGSTRFSGIVSRSGLASSAALAPVLAKLVAMGIAEKETPVSKAENRKRTSYRISDGFVSFYCRYIAPRLSARAVMDPEAFFERFIAEDLESEFIPKRFERVCAEFLVRQNKKGLISPAFDAIGKCRCDLPAEKRSREFDLVTHDPAGFAFYEAKFRKSPVTADMIAMKVEEVRATGLEVRRFGFFSRSGFDEAALGMAREGGLSLYTLADLYALEP